MGKQLTVFKNEMFGNVRIIEKDNKPYFGATDCAKCLGYKNTNDAIKTHCKKDGVAFHEVIDSLGRNQQMKFISEGNLYRLISKSKLPEAEKFETWIFDEVLVDIRKNGIYATETTIDSMLDNPDFAITLLTKYKEEKEERKKLEEQNKEKDGLLLKQGQKTSLYDDFIGSDDIYSIDNVSKTFAIKGMGRNKLYKYLRENYILMTDTYEDYNGKTRNGLKHYTAFARYTNTQQYFKHRQRKYYIGSKIVKQNVAMFTPKGINWIYKRLQRDGYVAKKDLNTIIEELKENRQVA